jgi:hypothetical protein
MANKKKDDVPDTRNPNQGTEDDVDKTRWETVDTNAGDDAVQGTVADVGPEDAGEPMDKE